ncbi:MAG: SCO family protein [Methylococcaceae bacterium]|nr:MAG: SCO family protein [Methylococcaceae bacterium]
MRKLTVWVAMGAWLMLPSLQVWAQDAAQSAIYQAPYSWTDDQGKAVSLADWRGKPVLMTMAFSTCRKFCPITLARLAEVQKLYDQRGIDAEFVVISYDPADTWQSWATFRKTHHYERANWHFLTGGVEATKAISQLLGMDYWFYDEHVLHNFKIVRLGPTGVIEATLGWDNQERVETLLPAP